MARFLVTGGAGFIGSHLVDSLVAEHHEVTILDDLSTGRMENLPPGIGFVLGDVCDAAAVRDAMHGCDGCFHLAAVASVQRSNDDWIGTHRTNVTGTVTVFDASRHLGGIPVVYASSAAVYGLPQDELLGEDAPKVPLSAYGADKLSSELHASVASGIHGVASVGFRFFNVFGARQDPKSPYSGVISIFAARALAGLPIVVQGDGTQARDFIHVSDIVRFLRAGMDACSTSPGARVYNACTGTATRIVDLASAIAAEAGEASLVTFAPGRLGDIRMSQGNPAKARLELGISANVRLDKGLADLLSGLRRGYRTSPADSLLSAASLADTLDRPAIGIDDVKNSPSARTRQIGGETRAVHAGAGAIA